MEKPGGKQVARSATHPPTTQTPTAQPEWKMRRTKRGTEAKEDLEGNRQWRAEAGAGDGNDEEEKDA